MDILFFGDQTADQYPLLQQLYGQKLNILVKYFLDGVSAALRHEIQALPTFRRDAFPKFTNISDLVELYKKSGYPLPELESSLVTTSQLAHFFAYYGKDAVRFPGAAGTRIVAICTGTLAAAAVSSVASLVELLPVAIEAVKISFRIGSCVSRARDVLDASSSAAQNWSFVVTGLTEDQVTAHISQFSQKHDISVTDKPYVSVLGTSSVTISGSPKITKQLFEQAEGLKSCPFIKIPIYAPYHANHLYNDADLECILDEDTRHLLEGKSPSIALHKASDGKEFELSDSFDLFRSVVNEILRKPVRWNVVLQEIQAEPTRTIQDLSILVFGASNITKSFVSSLKSSGLNVTNYEDEATWYTRSKNSRPLAKNEKIAIVGMAGRFPGADNHEALWQLLEQGLDMHKEVPPDRFDAKAHCDSSGKSKNKSHTPYGCFIDEPGLFDARFFNMSPREAAQTDPMGRLAIVTAYEALEMSGFVPNRTPSSRLDRVGTFYGQTSDDWREINAAEDIDTYFITGGVRAFCAGRINYFFKFSGPSFSIDTACSSSLAAIQLACTSLWAGDCDTACAGGLNVLTNPDIFSGLSKGQFLSKTGSCKTYDNAADGYCRGDGCASVVLKRYEDAITDNDNILGCILSAATNHSADAISITHPHAGAQEVLYKKVLADANVDALDVSYVEMHGTGTQAGDGVEMTSVTEVFAPRDRLRRVDQPLYLGAIKANIGHGEAASGTNSMVKVLLMMQKNMIPPNVGIKGIINQTFPKDLNQRNVRIETKNVPYPREAGQKRKIFINNFSAAGGNTAVLLEDGPEEQRSKTCDPRCTHVVVTSAKSIASLKNNIRSLSDYASAIPGTNLADLSYTTTARRVHYNYRVAVTVSYMGELSGALDAQLKDSYRPVPVTAPKVCFAFTGQGSQYPAIGRQLYETSALFRQQIELLDRIVRMHEFPSVLALLTANDIQELSPLVIQLGLVCIQVALVETWRTWGIKPSVVIGHSLGEYAALHTAGVITTSDMIRLVGRRAQLLQSHTKIHTHGMLAVRASIPSISKIMGQKMPEIACVNGPQDTVLSGSLEVIDSVQEVLSSEGLRCTKLLVPYAFHSAQVDPICEPFKAVAKAITFNKPQIPIISTLLGTVVADDNIINDSYLVRHAREPVNFLAALEAGHEQQIFGDKSIWLEIGPHQVCSGMVKSRFSEAVTLASLRRNEKPWNTLANTVCFLHTAGLSVDFSEYHRDFASAHKLVPLPAYKFDQKRYWLDYHNNWTLTKGEDLSQHHVPSAAALLEGPPAQFTTSCQHLLSEEINGDSGTVVFESDLDDVRLRNTVSGHLVNGNPLCPSSLYADMAMTAGDYLYKKLRPGKDSIGLNVCDMEVFKPLIVSPSPSQKKRVIQIEAKADMRESQMRVKYRSAYSDGTNKQEHAVCIVRFEPKSDWRDQWIRSKFMVETQINLLEKKLVDGRASKILRGMAYKLFKALVTYDRRYQGMQEVVLDAEQTEALSRVRFQTTPEDGNFFFSPYWIDSLAHISGFIMNASDLVDSTANVFISHGWKSIRMNCIPSPDKEYRSYVRMLPTSGTVYAGDVYVFEGSELVGVVEGLKFQNIPRKALTAMLPHPVDNKSSEGHTVPRAANKSRLQKAQLPLPAVKPAVVKTRTKQKAEAKNVGNGTGAISIVSKVIDIIAVETNQDHSELVEDAAFENLGVDSLMSLTISAKLREELDLEIDSTLFVDYPTVGELKRFFSQYDSSEKMASSDASDVSSEYPSDDAAPSMEEIETPMSSLSSASSSVMGESRRDDKPAGPNGTDASFVRKLIAQEMGVSIDEIASEADLADHGMDSLMSLAILSTLREHTGLDLASSFLLTNNTIEQIEASLGLDTSTSKREKSTGDVANKSRRPSFVEISKRLRSASIDISKYPPATSALLQGNGKTARTKLYLFPDGSGSATSYAAIPKLDSSIAVFGFNCPFMQTPEQFTCGIEGVAAIFVAEMKRRQPKGPYCIGGWSAGGVIAYEVTKQLALSGEKIERLILIDSPCPVRLEPLPTRLHHFFDSIGLLGTGKAGGTPSWLLPHFAAAIKALTAYDPSPLPSDLVPKTLAIWATDGVCGKPGDPRPPPVEGEDPKPMKWLLENRTDFGDNGWAYLLGDDKLEFAVMGGNHFSILNGEHSKTLSQSMKKFLQS